MLRKKEKRGKRLHIYRLLTAFMVVLGLIVGGILPCARADAAQLSIRYNGKTYKYTNVEAKVTLDKKNINLGGTPGVLINNTCMVPAKNVFASGLGGTYSYNSAAKKITISNNSITVVMTVNSKTAYVNGIKKTLDEAPKNITFTGKNVTKIYVPSRFVAEALGYTYVWNTKSKAADITSPFIIKYDKDWTIYAGTQGKVSFDEKSISVMEMPGLIFNNTTLIQANKVFKANLGADYVYDKASKTVIISQNDIEILMTLNSTTALVNGQEKKMGTAPRLIYNKQTGKSHVMVPAEFVATNLGYAYRWDSDTATSVITTKPKPFFTEQWAKIEGISMITQVEGFSSNGSEVINVTGENLPVATVIDNGTYLDVYLDDIYSGCSYNNYSMDTQYVQGITIEPYNNGVKISIQKAYNSGYYTKTSGKIFSIVIGNGYDADIAAGMFQLKMTLPQGVTFDSVTTEDLYYKKQFTLLIPGDYTAYFVTNPINYDLSIVNSVIVEPDFGNTKITVNTTKLQGFELLDCGTYVGVKIANPNLIYDKIVVLDAGHGGSDPGTSKTGTFEKDLNYTILYEYAKEYFNSPESNIKAYWTRCNDTFISLDERAAFAKSVGADLFVSLHMNSASSSASGTEVFYSKTNTNTSMMGSLNSQDLASIFYEQLIWDLGLSERGVKTAEFVVIKKNTVPSVLIELGFLSNAADYACLIDPEFQDAAARSIYDATVSVFDNYSTGR
ncbi:N-acetylmuramoyl-L-alanine amidase [Anaerosporobacter sp.]|uniref:N-acetylmuramoyl-L-alanine amidase n=1 Tax=Anaerosporobacter sp. TaxID=1872529 RepID=UPI00286EDC4D|nr:N-acetylmuramoyl-L-alanine amidase [Anaerosporobacter sp.]